MAQARSTAFMAAIALGALEIDASHAAHVSHQPEVPNASQYRSPSMSASLQRLIPRVGLPIAFCDAQNASSRPSTSAKDVDSSAGYAEWLAARGVEGLDHITISADGTASLNSVGKQLYPSRWKRFGRSPPPAVVVAFPLDGTQVLSEATICAEPSYAKYADKGYNMIVMYLLIERMKAEHGLADPWMDHIAGRRFSSPITWSFDEVDWLRGTSLYRAVMHQRESLKQEWEHGGMRQASSEIAKAAGLRSPTFEDLTWATAAFTLFAVPLSDARDNQDNPHGMHSLQIVPGLEMFSPSTGTAPAGKTVCHLDIDASKHQLCVVCPPAQVATSLSLSLSHGEDDASVEQMMFQFGSLDVDPSNEVLMIECPIPPVEEWDASIKRRFALLLEEDLRPQLFLSRRALAEIKKTAGQKARNSAERQQRFERMFPEGVRETIAIFVMDEDDLKARTNDRKGTEEGAVATHDAEEAQLAAAGMRMAVLTTVVRLLEVKQYELESEEHGTGSLAMDQRLLENINEEQRGTTAMPHSGPTVRQLAALRHRMEQKRLVRDYMEIYSEALQNEMAHMKTLG